MFVSQGLVDPKVSHKLSWSKGKQVNIPVHGKYTVTFDGEFLTLRDMSCRIFVLFNFF